MLGDGQNIKTYFSSTRDFSGKNILFYKPTKFNQNRQPFRHFTYVTTHSPTLPSLYQRHSSFSNPSVASPTSQFILQPFFRFFYVTSSSLNSPGEPPMPLSKICRTFQPFFLLILQPFRHFTYVTTHSPTLPSLYQRQSSFSNTSNHLHHSSSSNPSFASPTSQALRLIHLACRLCSEARISA